MKTTVSILVTMVLVMQSLVGFTQEKRQQDQKTSSVNDVEVYYFHFTRRCMTCNTVESETIKSLESLYPVEVKEGKIKFISINLDDDSSKPIAEKCKISGQGLVVMSGDKRKDLTSQGFMYAVRQPERLKKEIKSAVDPMLAKK